MVFCSPHRAPEPRRPGKWRRQPVIQECRRAWRFAFGRVLLLGDAAHATTPNLGQGANQAIKDGLALVDCLMAAPPANGGVYPV